MSDKKIYGLLIFFTVFIFIMYIYNKYKVAPSINLHQLEIVDESSRRFDVDSLKGQKVIVSFYASWCPDCLKELKIINSIKDSRLASIKVLAVTDESIEKMVHFKEKKQYPFTFLKLKKSFHDIGVYSIPTIYLLNTKGDIVYQHVGYVNWDDASTVNHLLTLMQ